MKQEYMIQDMKRIMTRLCVLTLLLLVSMTAGAKVEVLLDDYKGGTIKVKSQADNDDGSTTVTITVTPNQGYTITRKGLPERYPCPGDCQTSGTVRPYRNHIQSQFRRLPVHRPLRPERLGAERRLPGCQKR